jgi:hypothetical protein
MSPRPIALTDDQMFAVIAAAQVLPPDLRSTFLAAVAHALRGVPVGDGSVPRIIREVQREFWHPPIETHGPGKYETLPRPICPMRAARRSRCAAWAGRA